MAEIRVKRAYRTARQSDGACILVDRLWPRGMSKDRPRLTDCIKDTASCGAECGDPGGSAALQRPALGQHLPRQRCLGDKGGRPLREALSPLPCRPEIDVDDPQRG